MKRRLIGLVAGALLWEIAGRLSNPFSFAPLSKVLVALANILAGPDIWNALLISGQSLVLGFVVALLLGLFLGVVGSLFNPVERIVDAYMTILLSVPMAAVIPLVVIMAGVGLVARSTVVFLFAFPIITLNTLAGVRGIDSNLLEMAHSYGAPFYQVVRRVILPGATPAVMTGVRLGLGRALVGMMTAELLLLSVGLGLLVDRFQATFQVANMWALLLVLLIMGGLTLGAVQALERRMAHWRS